MDELFAEKNYNPEDEYAPIDASPEQEAAQDAPDDDIPYIDPPVQRTMPRGFEGQPEDPADAYQPADDARAFRQQPVYDRQPMYDQPPRYAQPPVQGYAPRYEQPQPQQGYAPQYGQPQPQQGYAPQYGQPQQGYAPQYGQSQPPQPPQGYAQQYGRPQPKPPVPPQQTDRRNLPQEQYRHPNSENPYAANRNLPQNAYGQPYRQQADNASYNNRKQPMPTGTKAFLIILCVLLAAMLIGFIIYVSASAQNQNNNGGSGNNIFNIDDNKGDDNNNGFSPFSNNSGSSYSDVEDEITLVEDKGETQKRDNDNEESVGKPNEKAENIKLEALPKDKDDEKYNKQSAYESVSDSVVTVECYKEKITDSEKDIASMGTGTIISSDGYIVTNAHVIGNSKAYAVNIVTNGNDKYQAKIIGYDTWTDLAVLKIDAKDLKAVTFGDSELVNVGDEVIAIGSPGGVKFQNSLTQGIISAVDRELSINRYVRYIQSDAAISPGNSGGPLCNIYGQVIGITTAKTVADYYENMTFSIPSATVEEVVGDLMRYGYVTGRCRIGFSGQAVSREEAFYYGYPAGIVISSIDDSGALADSDFKEGDIITEVDGEEVTSFQDIYNILANHKPGDKIKIKASRPKE